MADDVGVYIKSEYFTEARNAKTVYDNEFVPALEDLKAVRKALDDKSVFKGKSRDEVLSLLEILEKLYERIVEDMEGYYDTFSDLESELVSKVEGNTFYTKVQP
ncbi:MAG: hypothetical protein ACK5LC_02895 [Coprobacillaceae bacterium]